MADKYHYTLGRRKTSRATVRLFEGKGTSMVNDKEFDKIYSNPIYKERIMVPFKKAELDPKKFYFTVKTSGGGYSSQIDAIILGIARAIVKMDEDKKPLLKAAGLLTRDPRMVERKKPGLKKARKAEQYSKR